ncbi:MAG: hypothetical protein MGG37_10170 [Trichodesmium sp. MAG_R01]|nr:hypothetical protein [Trichodesmium sp. MAG_R01]
MNDRKQKYLSNKDNESALLHECFDRNFSPQEKLIRIPLCSFLTYNPVSYD